MPIRFNCTCGVLLEVDDHRAGQSLDCPDCRRSVRVPAPERPHQRTSWLALASITLALIGAFTIVGTLLAVVLGALALRTISRRRDRLAGQGFAVAGVLLGILFTGLSVIAYSSFDLFGFNSILRRIEWAGNLDYGEPMERPAGSRYSVTRPSSDWGEYRNGQIDDSDELILANVRKDAFVTCLWFWLNGPERLDAVGTQALAALQRSELVRLLAGRAPPGEIKLLTKKLLPTRNGLELLELHLSGKLGRRARKLLVHLARTHDDERVYVIAGVARSDQFEHVEDELRQILESFKIRR